MRLGIATDHGGFGLKEDLAERLRAAGHDVTDFGAHTLEPGDDFPDFVIPLARAVAAGAVERGVAVCGSGVGAAVCANKIPGARAALIEDHFSAVQGVQDDHMNIICMGGRITGPFLAWDLLEAFLAAQYGRAERYLRRLDKIAALERNPDNGMVTIRSHQSVERTVQTLTDTLAAKQVQLFALIDHSGEAKKAGIEMRPARLLLFGNPKAGTPLMLASPETAIDLPLKILVREDAEGKVWISYNSPGYLQARHGLPEDLVQNIAVVGTLAAEAAEGDVGG